MSNKKMEVTRLILFLVLAYAISWIPAILLNETIGYEAWFTTNKVPLLALPAIYGPALANVLTRVITKEGWHDSMLHLRIRGNVKYYILSVVLVLVVSVLTGIMLTLVYGGGDFSDLGMEGVNGMQLTGGLLSAVGLMPLMAFVTFGEEFGWRAYMNQKMEPLLGTTGTVIVGGILWGLWHAELTVVGHNFGTDYPGYPYMGFLAMCVKCIFFGIGLMWVTKKTGSVYPAAIMHAANNYGGSMFATIFASGVPEDFELSIPRQLLVSIPGNLLFAVLLVLMLLEKKKDKAAPAAA